MPSTIQNAADIALGDRAGTVPDVSGGLRDYFQPMTFTLVTKATVNFQLVETLTPIEFRGVIQPLRNRDLQLKPEGQRSWTWFMLHSDSVLALNTDEIVLYRGVPTRIMARQDFALYGYTYYELVQNFT